MEESVSAMATAAGAARRAKKAASKRATTTPMAASSVGAPGSNSNGMQRNSTSTPAAAASSESAGLAARTNGGGSGGSVSAAFAPNVSRMRNFGRLKSFSSRQRTMPAMQKAARSGGAGGPAGASAARNAQSSRWTQRNTTTTASEGVHVDLSGDSERVAVTNRQQQQDEEETKENLSIASMPPPETQHQQIQQSRQPQRMRCLKLKCAAHPDLVMPYLYGDRKSRINSIMQETGCTIDYCPMSPDEEAQSPQSRAYIMNFLISAESAENLEEAIRMLRALVEKVETHLQKKMRIRSLHAASAYRQLEIDQPGTQYSQESHDGLVYSGEYDAEYVKVESNRSVDRMEQETEQYSARPRHPISPVSLETPIDSFRQHNSTARRRDRIDRSVEQERGARMAVQYDDDIAYYDKWGRPVYRQELGVDGEEYDAASGDDVVGQVSDVPSRQQVSRLLQRRRWQYVDESDWSRHHRSFVHVSPASEDRVASPPGSARRRKASIHRRYVPPYHHSGAFGDDEYEEVYRARRSSREGARVATFHTEERYSDIENDLLEHEDDVLAAQEFAIKSRAQANYGARRGVKRSPGQFREVSPPPFQQKRPAPPTSNAHYPYELFDGQTGEWLSDDEDLGIVYRRHPRQPAVLYPHMHMSYQATRVPRGRHNSFSAPTAHSRSAPPDSPREEMPKRRKTSVVSQTEDFLRKKHSRIQVSGSILTSRDDHACDSSARAIHGAQLDDGERWTLPADENTVRSVHFGVPENLTTEEELQHLAHLEKGLPSDQAEQQVRGTADTSAVYERRDELHDSSGTAAGGLTKTTLDEDELMASEQIEGKSQQLQGCEVVSSLGENTADFADSNTSGASGSTNGESSDQVRVPDGVVSSGLSFSIPASAREDVEGVNSLAEQPRSVCTSLPLPSEMAFAQDRAGEHAKTEMMFTEEPSAPVFRPHSNNWRIRANELLVASLHKDTSLEVERAQVQHDVKSHLKKYLAFEGSSKLLAQLDELSTTAHDLQCQVVSASCKLSTSARRQMLDVLDNAVQAATRSDKSTQEKTALLKDGIEKALSLCGVDLSLETPARGTFVAETLAQNIVQSPRIAPDTTITYESPTFDDNDNNWESADGWFENADDHYEMEVFEEDEAVVPDVNPARETTSNRDAPLVPKKEEIVLLSPTENQSYASNLFGEASLCSPTSFVMKGMQKRLFGEIERANVYYYLHPVKLPDADSAKPRSTCEFGCSSGSAGGWVQKVTSQISSRMKWFDEVTYSLARARSGGAEAGSELLNRKKMNSTIRKLHLMAIQLHCLVSHLYCVRGRSECKENDSLAAALNSSYFEKRMTAYKSRLKLEADLHGTPDELLRDTFEFFPEFLLCIEMWGFDYREGTGSSGEVNKIRKSVKALPIQLFGHVESAVFDYEFDKNGFLQTVCEELLSIVCLWNDFVWGDNLETLPVERIAVFESEMKKNVAKILQTFSLHLMGSWAIRLLDNPDELQGLRFTQQNAYYAESSKMRGLASSNQSGGKFPGSWEEIGRCDDEEEAVKQYWKVKADACGLANVAEKRAGELPSSLLSIDAIEKWGKEETAAHLLKWSRVFEIRGELETCGVVLNDLLKDVMTDASVDGDADPANLVATELLRIVGRSRVVGADLAARGEMMALHSASFQLPQEMKSREASEIQKEPIPEPAEEVSGIEEPNGASEFAVDDEKPAASSSQSDVKDLIQILASTRKEVEEIFCARTRSGRMRDKLQSQSVQLAQQTIDLFQNISTMRTE